MMFCKIDIGAYISRKRLQAPATTSIGTLNFGRSQFRTGISDPFGRTLLDYYPRLRRGSSRDSTAARCSSRYRNRLGRNGRRTADIRRYGFLAAAPIERDETSDPDSTTPRQPGDGGCDRRPRGASHQTRAGAAAVADDDVCDRSRSRRHDRRAVLPVRSVVRAGHEQHDAMPRVR